MTRLARIIAPGIPHHVTQRGNRRQRVFFRDADYDFYLELLREWNQSAALPVLAYCLMSNHVHLIAVPPDETTLTRVMSEVHRRYSKAINQRNIGSAISGKAGMPPIRSTKAICTTRFRTSK